MMRKDWLALSFIWVVIFGFCYEVVFLGMSPFQGDIPLQFYPWKAYVQEMLGRGEVPYWNPYTYGGAPFLANMQSAVFYPLDLVLLLFPLERFFGLSLLLHFLLAGTGAYLLARVCGASAWAGILAGVAYGLNGFAMIHIPAGNHYTYAGAAWIPWMLFASAGFIRTRHSRLPWVVGGAVIAFLHFLCGHPQMMFYSLFFSLLLCLVLGVWESRCRAEASAQEAVVRTLVWGGGLSLGVFMAGMQLYPTLEYVFSASRSVSMDLQMATEFSFAPHRIVGLFFPEYFGSMAFGNHTESFVYWSCAYAGILIPMLATLLFFTGRKPSSAVPLAAVALIALLFAWGRGNPVYSLLYQLPGFGHFRAPAKYLPYYVVCISVLASLGIDAFARAAQEKCKRPDTEFSMRLVTWAVVFTVISVLFIVFMPYLYSVLRSTPGEDRQAIHFYALGIGFFFAFGGVVLSQFARNVPRHTLLILALSFSTLTVIDLFTYGRPYYRLPLRSIEQIQQGNRVPPELGVVRSPLLSNIPERMMNLKDIYYPNLFMQWKRANLAGYDPLSLRSFNEQIGGMEGWEPDSFHDDIRLSIYDHPVLDHLNVKYVVTRAEISEPSLAPVRSGPSFRVYERTSANRGWAGVADPASATGWRVVDGDIQWEKYRPHEIVFSYATTDAVDMRVGEWAYPGWHAEAMVGSAAKPVAISTAEEGLRVLHLPRDTETVRMVYRAPRLGWVMAFCAWVVFSGLAGLLYLKRTDWFWIWLSRWMGRV